MKRTALLLALLLAAAGCGGIERAPPADAFPLTAWRFRPGDDPSRAKPDHPDREWKAIRVPARWRRAGYPDLDGFAWYRCPVELATAPGGRALLELGKIAGADEAFVNGVKVGASGAFPPDWRSAWFKPRLYPVPAGLLRTGRNVVAVRVYDGNGSGGLYEGPVRLITGEEAEWMLRVLGSGPTGYPCANFGLMAEVPAGGGVIGRLYANPNKLGPWLQRLGYACLEIKSNGVRLLDRDFSTQRATRAWPTAAVVLEDQRMEGLRATARVFCPLSRRVESVNAVGFAVVELRLESDRARDVEVALAFRPAISCAWRSRAVAPRGIALVADRGPEGCAPCLVYEGPLAGHTAAGSVSRVTAAGAIEPGVPLLLRFAVGHGSPPNDLADPHWRDETQDVADCLPRTGDPELDDYLRWYATAGVGLTRLLPDGRVLTMGYAELNQRDSFWTSWLHLALWPDLERRMIEESAAAQAESGKIPTTILPTIEREDDLDINAYFILRAARYVEWVQDTPFARRIWPAVRNALDWLESRDLAGDGLPEQVSFWGDWKDVSGMADRRHSPYAAFLYAAAARATRRLATRLELPPTETERLAAVADGTLKAINRNTAEGGLWNGRFYVNRFKDGSVNDRVQQDQLVGAVFGLVPSERLDTIYAALDEGRKPWGLPETWPFRPRSFGYAPGDYHNGAVWPWLTFVDAFGRFRSGRADDALRLIRAVAHHDLVKEGDFLPHECLHGRTGRNLRVPIQAWNAGLFGAVFFGYWGIQRTGADRIDVRPARAIRFAVTTPIPLPEGALRITFDGKGGGHVTGRLERPLMLRIHDPAGIGHRDLTVGGRAEVLFRFPRSP